MTYTTGTLSGGGCGTGFKPLPRRPSSDQLSRSLHSVGLAIATGGKSEADLGLPSRPSGALLYTLAYSMNHALFAPPIPIDKS